MPVSANKCIVWAYQVLVAMLLVMHLVWPLVHLPTLKPLLANSGFEMFWNYDDYRQHQGPIFNDVAILVLSWVALVFWVALANGLMRFVPVARGILVLILLIAGASYVLSPHMPVSWRYAIDPHALVLTLDAIIGVLAFLPPIANAYSEYGAYIASRPDFGRFPFFRSENRSLALFLTAILIVCVGNRLMVEDWNRENLTKEDLLMLSKEDLEKAKASENTEAIDSAYSQLGYAYEENAEYEKAIRTYEQAYADTGAEQYAIKAAWLYATAPEVRARDGRKAIAIITPLLTSSGDVYPRPYLLDVLAAAYAEVGDFDRATTTAEEAIILQVKAGELYRIEDFGKHLLSYREKQPWRSGDHDQY